MIFLEHITRKVKKAHMKARHRLLTHHITFKASILVSLLMTQNNETNALVFVLASVLGKH